MTLITLSQQNRLSKVICKLPAVPPGEIMFISAFKADRLQVNLQLVVNCLKLIQLRHRDLAAVLFQAGGVSELFQCVHSDWMVPCCTGC